MVSEILVIIEQNPIVMWLGIVLTAVLFLVYKHLENMEGQEKTVPKPSELDDIVIPRLRKQLDNRGKTPDNVFFKIGRDKKGLVDKYLDTKVPSELLDPNPEGDSSGIDIQDPESIDEEPEGLTSVRITQLKPYKTIDKVSAWVQALLGKEPDKDRTLMIFKKDSFIQTPDKDMVVDPETLSYNFAGMEVEIDDATRNVVYQSVSTEVSEQVLAALPNYTEKVDYLFPHHSQELGKIKTEGEHRGGDDAF